MKCNKSWAYKLIQIRDGKVEDLFLCSAHAREASPTVDERLQLQATLLGDVLQFISQQQAGASAEEDARTSGRVCSNCGLGYNRYRRTMLLGCSDCYRSFEDLLVEDLRRLHGAVSQDPDEVQTPPKAPATAEAAASPKVSVAREEEAGVLSAWRLRQQMEAAIRKEDFERAAILRDAIRDIESRQTKDKPSE
jgi:protein arginine kinase activator